MFLYYQFRILLRKMSQEKKETAAKIPEKIVVQTIEEIAAVNDAKFKFFFKTSSPFSQWHPCEFADPSGIVFTSTEQYMMYQKAKLFGDNESARKIADCKDPREIKALGRTVVGFDEAIWERERINIVITGNLLKFTQNPKLRAKLVGTHPKILVEASPYDKIWGIGLSEDTARVTHITEWKGENLLGLCLTSVRESIMQRERMSQVPAATITPK